MSTEVFLTLAVAFYTDGLLDVAVRDRVECRYREGKVSNRRGNRIRIDYDDGSREWTSPRMCRTPVGH